MIFHLFSVKSLGYSLKSVIIDFSEYPGGFLAGLYPDFVSERVWIVHGQCGW